MLSKAAAETRLPSGYLAVQSANFDHIDAIAKWCECLQGKQPLLTALREVAEAVGARSVCLSRHAREHIRMAQVVALPEPQIVASSAEVDRSYAYCVLGVYLDRPRVGSVWLSSQTDERNDPALSAFQKTARIAVTAVIPLALEDKQVDYLELHFATSLSEPSRLLLDMVAGALSRIWATRRPGLFADAVLSSRTERCTSPVQGRLLSTANPAHLSRAEFRVCLLLSRGLSQSGICKELSISPATYRTHLRNTLKKTGVATLTELLFVLLAPPTVEELLSHHLARVA